MCRDTYTVYVYVYVVRFAFMLAFAFAFRCTPTFMCTVYVEGALVPTESNTAVRSSKKEEIMSVVCLEMQFDC